MPPPFDLVELNGTLEGCLRMIIMQLQMYLKPKAYVTFSSLFVRIDHFNQIRISFPC